MATEKKVSKYLMSLRVDDDSVIMRINASQKRLMEKLESMGLFDDSDYADFSISEEDSEVEDISNG